ncbi:hypothetical protein BDZ45DRAFT_740724 [Acephala macrosclerotiorum]|nr:hypothetical protein BDZ45DRAFT_740724 [Acephala macrosclerotiorum]
MFYRPTSFWSWTLLVATVIETGTVLAIESVILSILNHSLLPNMATIPEVKTIPTFLALLTFEFVYQVLLLYNTLAQRTLSSAAVCVSMQIV